MILELRGAQRFQAVYQKRGHVLILLLLIDKKGTKLKVKIITFSLKILN